MIALSIGLLTPAQAFAATQQCTPARSPHDDTARYVWTHGTPSNVNGISANILEMNPYYTGHNGTGTNASIMLVRWNPVQWAQLGWAKSKMDDGSTIKRQVFAEFYLSASQNYYRFWAGRTIQTETWYEILNDGSNSDFYVAGSWVANYTGFAPTEYQIFGETHDIMDQMPGVSSNVQTFRNAVYFTGTGGTHNGHYATNAVNVDASFYGGQKNGDGIYYAWDKCTAAVGPVAPGEDKELVGGTPASDTIVEQDLPMIGLDSAVDVTNLPAAADPPEGIDRFQALTIAQDEIGGAARVYRATASEFVDSAVLPVWVVTVPGGTPPADGPVGGPAIAPAGYTGVIIDATTGRVWSKFMH